MATAKTKGIVLLTSGGVVTAALLAALFAPAAWNLPRPPATWLVVTGLVAFILLAVGVNLLMAHRRRRAGEDLEPVDYRHAIPVFLLLGLVLVAALAVRQAVFPESFGQWGPYRAQAVLDARDRAPRYVGRQACAECHEEVAGLHAKDLHATVQCENCHGAGWKHVKDPEEAPLTVPEGREPCLVCHDALDARFGAFPQIEWRAHYEAVGVDDPAVVCTQCHSPHEPLFLDRPLAQARLHPLVHRCRDCHVGRTDESLERPDGHPVIFSCDYCHGNVVEDFQDRAHGEVGCTTCHLFIKETEFSGRIIRDADPRFCLLCHRAAEFRSGDGAPPIAWPEHLEDVADDEADEQKRCVDCHREAIHATPEGDDDE